MAYSIYTVAPNSTFVLKLINFRCHCEGCEKKLKKLLLKIPGVHSVAIDLTQEIVTISGTVDPCTVIKELAKKKTQAEVFLKPISPQMNHPKEKQITVQSQPPPPVIDQEFNDRNLVAQIDQFSRIKGLKEVEVTYSKTVKVTLGRKNDDELSKKIGTHKKIVMDDDNDDDDNVGFGSPEVHRGGHHGGPSRLLDLPPPPQPMPNYAPSAPPWEGPYSPYRTSGYISVEENPNGCTLM